MLLHDREILEALSSSKVLTSMITPAVLISASGTLIFSTSGRLGRVFDRVNALKAEVEGIAAKRLSHPRERLEHVTELMAIQGIRGRLLQRALSALYTATALFIASSIAIAMNVAFGGPDTSWAPTGIALFGGLFLFAASALLLYESRFNLKFIEGQMRLVNYLKDQITVDDDKPS
ncbi:DUF2721 domain-containing protein [Geomesophilobacter sediminis]|uniref:DUF2721 domain-containing protein n=1 Tax=Geomesophilobacter sediminis TaxID=2798584 RepID=A0A8J7JAR6_9BACT|nr:DUF2721 domain-containing protein [Geomesophilobacter sediminis]MBJ6723518.1 DUF2721 domain-containing protein [Geomesophilobacter sediminis]